MLTIVRTILYSCDSDVNKLKYDEVRDTFDNIKEHEVPDHAIKVTKEALDEDTLEKGIDNDVESALDKVKFDRCYLLLTDLGH